MKNNANLINTFSNLKVMVVGDVMTDAYIFGKVERISPEAPVPVVHISGREMRPGGAANVAINVVSMGAKAVLCSVTGDDDNGNEFLNLLKKENINASGILRLKGRKSTVKTRVIGNNHQLLRVDDESAEPLNHDAATSFIDLCNKIIRAEKPDVIIFEDYDKGVLTKEVIDSITETAKTLFIPTAVDPKRKNFNTYKNITLFKPNLHELKSGLNISIDTINKESLTKAVNIFLKERGIRMVMVTLSEAGVFIATSDEAHIVPAHVRNISDVSGAGDTVIAVAALCLAAGLPASTIAGLSNLAGGLVCEMVGVVPINKEKLFEEAGKIPTLFETQKS